MKYLYIVNYPKGEKELFELEMKLFFGDDWAEPYFISEKYVARNRSLYLKYQLQIDYVNSCLEELVKEMWLKQYTKDDYKVYYLEVNGIKTHFEDRLASMRKVGQNIVGNFNMLEVKDKIGVVKLNGFWYVGSLVVSDPKWERYIHKPQSYSQSLPIRVAKSIVNLAIGDNLETTVIDGCCGVGTVVLEGLYMGANIIGCEVNWHIANHAKENLSYYCYDHLLISHQNFLENKQLFDCCILDLPYGIVSKISVADIDEMLKKAYSIAKKLILVTTEPLVDLLKEIGYCNVQIVCVRKQNFKRYIQVAE
jgi:Predicted DNA modification methylase